MTRYRADYPIGHPTEKAKPGWPAGAIITDKDLPAEKIEKLLAGGLLSVYEEPKKEEGKK